MKEEGGKGVHLSEGFTPIVSLISFPCNLHGTCLCLTYPHLPVTNAFSFFRKTKKNKEENKNRKGILASRSPTKKAPDLEKGGMDGNWKWMGRGWDDGEGMGRGWGVHGGRGEGGGMGDIWTFGEGMGGVGEWARHDQFTSPYNRTHAVCHLRLAKVGIIFDEP